MKKQCHRVNWIYQDKDIILWQRVEKTVMNFWVQFKGWESSTISATVSFSRSTVFHGVAEVQMFVKSISDLYIESESCRYGCLPLSRAKYVSQHTSHVKTILLTDWSEMRIHTKCVLLLLPNINMIILCCV